MTGCQTFSNDMRMKYFRCFILNGSVSLYEANSITKDDWITRQSFLQSSSTYVGSILAYFCRCKTRIQSQNRIEENHVGNFKLAFKSKRKHSGT